MALAAYRNLLRSVRIAFEGDTVRLMAARAHSRKNFEDKRYLEPHSAETSTSIAHAEEVAQFLRANVVQAEADATGKYKLRIHEHTERGDNEDIKKGKGKTLAGTKCCSS